jgi:hypothetical protein
MFSFLVSIILDFPFCDAMYVCSWRETSGVRLRDVADRTVTVTDCKSEKNMMELNTGTYNRIQVLVRCKILASTYDCLVLTILPANTGNWPEDVSISLCDN